MPNPVTFPNGQILTSTALNPTTISTIFRAVTAQILGINSGRFIGITTTAGSTAATVNDSSVLAVGQNLNGASITPGSTVATIGSANAITLSLPALASATNSQAIANFDLNAASAVRIKWPTTGQPDWNNTDDVCFIQATEEDDSYNRIRDRKTAPNNASTVLDQWFYTRVWRIGWTFYGPNSCDNARSVRSALFFDEVRANLSNTSSLGFFANPTSPLYLVPPPSTPVREPEGWNSQYWERVDMYAKFNEFVTETITVGLVASVEVLVYDPNGKQEDLTIVQ